MKLLKYLEKIAVYGFWFGGITMVFFAPEWFYFDVRVGLLSFLSLHGEAMGPGGHRYEVHFSMFRFLVSTVLWAVLIFAVYKWLRYLDSKAYVS